MNYYLYILFSKIFLKTYTGSTNHLERRIQEHNVGKVKSSRHYKPYELLHFEQYLTLKEARNRELFFKTTLERKKIKELIDKRINNL